VFEIRGYLRDVLLSLLLRTSVLVEVGEVLINLHSFSLGDESLLWLLSLFLGPLLDLRGKFSRFG
jgi:hypothetical protein